uniref:isocitrate lyase/PEP mutase family protein n=2 Tax=Arthrobacter sp. H41 TaxID=1312978 RepID=UPI0004BA2CFC|nr:isocitrate lyase/phosphoenolpyruvate mutase family protein [Arthrobacter sp. H41]
MTIQHTPAMDLPTKATELLRLHTSPKILQVINVWDAITAKTIAAVPGTEALATASHSIAASLGYDDGENIPVDLMIQAVGRIAAATSLPVSADLESGYGNPGDTVRRAIGAGIVGANIEDQMRPLADAVAQMEAAVKAGQAEGIDFVLNARTDAFLKAADRSRDDVLADAIERGRAFLEVGAASVFVPGLLDEPTVRALVEGIGQQRVSVINVPGSLAPSKLQELGVARISYGPWTQRVALTALADSAAGLLADGALPEGTRPLN